MWDKKIGDSHMEISYFYLMIYLLRAQINLGIKHNFGPMPIHFGKFTSRFFVCIAFTICSATYVGFNMYRPIFSHMYRIDQLFQKFVSIGPGLIAVTKIFVLDNSMRKLFVNPSTACFSLHTHSISALQFSQQVKQH